MAADRREEIERFFLKHRRGVGSYLCARVGDLDAAEAITARVFLAVVRCWDQCHSSRVAWLWAIVRNEIARHFRRRRPDMLAEDVLGREASPPEEVELRETRLRLQSALERLADPQREIVFLKFFQQMRNKEIAEATGRSAEHIGVLVHRALDRLRRLMTESETSVPQ